MKALITGITGQDGSYLAELLIEKGYEVHGTIRRSSSINTNRIDNLISKTIDTSDLSLHYSDLLDSASLSNLVSQIQPDEIYNLGAQSHVAVSFQNPLYTTQTSTIGPLALLESIKNSKKDIKFYQASSSEMYGGKEKVSLNEESPLLPRSPYASSKVFAHEINKIYRESYNIFGVNGILFNHESPRRGETFVTRKISKAIGRIHHGLQEKLTLGNLKASRDWGFAGDYVKAIWMMMQHEKPDDWVVATGETYTVENFLIEGFNIVGLDWKDYVVSSEKYFRPNEVDYLLGDPAKIKNQLGWSPEVDFKELVKMMVENDLNEAEKELTLVKNKLLKPTWEHPAK
tara:strand:- start:19506 stop:20537 length:1032 start_codon:yes stop_codon:yes gene_type:complete